MSVLAQVSNRIVILAASGPLSVAVSIFNFLIKAVVDVRLSRFVELQLKHQQPILLPMLLA